MSINLFDYVTLITKTFSTHLTLHTRKTQLYITMFFHSMTFQIMFVLGNVIAMTTVVWTSRNVSEISIRDMFCFNMNFPHMPEVTCFPNAQAALVAEVASQAINKP